MNYTLRAHKFEGQELLALKRQCARQIFKNTLFCIIAGIFQERTGKLSVLTVGTSHVFSILSTENDFRSIEFLGNVKG